MLASNAAVCSFISATISTGGTNDAETSRALAVDAPAGAPSSVNSLRRPRAPPIA